MLEITITGESARPSEYSTDSSEKAIENAAQKEVTNAMRQFRRDLNAQLQMAGDGIMGTISSTNGASTTWSLNNTPFGARLVRENLPIQVYDTTMATNRGEVNVLTRTAGLGLTQQVIVSAFPAGTVATDNIVAAGLSGASPVSLYGIPSKNDEAELKSCYIGGSLVN